MRLRITWGGGEASRWFGRVWLDEGSLSNLKLLGLAADSAGSVWLQDGELHVASISPREQDSIELAAIATVQSQLSIELSPDSKKPPSPIRVPLADVLARPYVMRLDERGNTLQIEVVPDEPLHIATGTDPLIFAPGEQFSFDLRPILADAVPGTTLDIRATLSPARRNELLWSDEQRLAVPVEGPPTIKLNVPLPGNEGVYEIRVSVTRPPGFRQRFFPGAAAPLAERSLDVVVLASSRVSEKLDDGSFRHGESSIGETALREWETVWRDRSHQRAMVGAAGAPHPAPQSRTIRKHSRRRRRSAVGTIRRVAADASRGRPALASLFPAGGNDRRAASVGDRLPGRRRAALRHQHRGAQCNRQRGRHRSRRGRLR